MLNKTVAAKKQEYFTKHYGYIGLDKNIIKINSSVSKKKMLCARKHDAKLYTLYDLNLLKFHRKKTRKIYLNVINNFLWIIKLWVIIFLFLVTFKKV